MEEIKKEKKKKNPHIFAIQKRYLKYHTLYFILYVYFVSFFFTKVKTAKKLPGVCRVSFNSFPEYVGIST